MIPLNTFNTRWRYDQLMSHAKNSILQFDWCCDCLQICGYMVASHIENKLVQYPHFIHSYKIYSYLQKENLASNISSVPVKILVYQCPFCKICWVPMIWQFVFCTKVLQNSNTAKSSVHFKSQCMPARLTIQKDKILHHP